MVYHNGLFYYLTCLLVCVVVLSVVQPSVHAAVPYGPAGVESGGVAPSAGRLPQQLSRPLLQDCPGKNSKVRCTCSAIFLKQV